MKFYKSHIGNVFTGVYHSVAGGGVTGPTSSPGHHQMSVAEGCGGPTHYWTPPDVNSRGSIPGWVPGAMSGGCLGLGWGPTLPLFTDIWWCPGNGVGPPPPVLTPSGGHWNTYSWQAGGMHPTWMLSCLGVFIKTCCRPQTKLQEGNVFTLICQSFCSQGEDPWTETPPPFTVKSGRYASYWNAFWYELFLLTRIPRILALIYLGHRK